MDWLILTQCFCFPWDWWKALNLAAGREKLLGQQPDKQCFVFAVNCAEKGMCSYTGSHTGRLVLKDDPQQTIPLISVCMFQSVLQEKESISLLLGSSLDMWLILTYMWQEWQTLWQFRAENLRNVTVSTSALLKTAIVL